MTNKEIISRLLKEDQNDIYVLTDLLSMAREVKNEDELLSKQIAQKVKSRSMNLCNTNGDYVSWNLYNDSLLFLAHDHKDFDSYMLYIEKEREPSEKFWQPRRKCLYNLVQDMQKLIDDKIDILSLSMPPGTAKAQPLYSKVLTPDGFIQMRDVKIGQKVISGTGHICNVIGVFPQGKKKIYEITFSDSKKTKVRCSIDHLWNVYDAELDIHKLVDLNVLIMEYRQNPLAVEYFPYPETHRKNERYYKFIEDISYIGTQECQCIYIDDPSHLYITDGYMVTHNTTMGEFFLSFMMGLRPNTPNLMSSHSGYVTRMFYDAVLNIITSREYKWGDVFPDVLFESNNAKEETINLGRWKPFKTLTCRPIRGSLTGVTRCEGFLYADDLVSGIEEALSIDRLDKLYGEYTTDLKSRKKLGCKEIHIATRWSVHDVIGRLEQQYSDDDRSLFIAVPATDPKTGKSNFNYDYGVGFDEKYFEDMRNSMDDVSYRCLFDNQPIEREGQLYHPDELMRYLDLPEKEPDSILGICDTKDTGSDYNCLLVFYQYGDMYYLVDMVFKNISPEVLDELNSDILVKHHVQQCQFESNKEGSRTGTKVAELVREKGGHCSITKKYTSQNKETKIIINSPWVKSHIVFKDPSLYEAREDYGVAMSQLCSYTQLGRNAHDDMPDCCAMFALYVDSMTATKVKIVKREELGF